MNLPNRLTVMRMILVPFFVAAVLYPFPHHFLIAFILFAVASYTDHLDGKLPANGLITISASLWTRWPIKSWCFRLWCV